MKTISGVYTSATIFTDVMEDYATAQIQMLCDNEAFSGCKIRVMPDVHPGKVGTIGFTSTIGNKILPNVTGIDIGCGVTIARLKQKKAEFQKLDTVIRECVPVGFAVRKKPHRFSGEFDSTKLNCKKAVNQRKAELSLGTLGGGNHFIELDQDEEGSLYVVIHTGSRHLGKEVTEYYLKEGQKNLKEEEVSCPYELTCLEGELMEEYLSDVQIVQGFAELNRDAILDELSRGMKWKIDEVYSVSHNYVDDSGTERILRKGAISAKKREKVVIPINMRDGILLGTGLGNEEWNCSAPHGAGRLYKREEVKNHYTVSDYKKAMKGIYSSCISKGTLDEAPFAYRGIEMIAENIKDTVEVTRRLRTVYNYKAEN